MNKKIWIIIAIVLVLIFASIAGVIALVFNLANKTKNPITATKFESIMKDNDYMVINSKEQFEEYDYIKESLIAMKKDGSYQLEFYVIENEEQAKKFFDNNKEIFEDSTSGTVESRMSNMFKNGQFLKINSKGKYMVISRIDNTVVYVNVSSQYKDSVDKMLEKLGY